MARARSPYEPPRAGRSRHFYRAIDRLRAWAQRHDVFFGDIEIPTRHTDFLLGCLVPGRAFCNPHWNKLSLAILGGWLAAGVVFLIYLGDAPSSLATTVMLSLHGMSILFVLNRTWPQPSLLRRMVLSVGVIFLLSMGVYQPFLGVMKAYWLLPLRMNDQTYVIHRTRSPQGVGIGDLVAYRAQAANGTIHMAQAELLDRILAGPGDIVEFKPGEFLINGKSFARLPLMPDSGRRVVVEKTWFIWPTLQIQRNANVTANEIAFTVLNVAMVPQSNVLGKPFTFWPWRPPNQ